MLFLLAFCQILDIQFIQKLKAMGDALLCRKFGYPYSSSKITSLVRSTGVVDV